MKKYILTGIFVLSFIWVSYGQHSQTLYYMDRLPQITSMNPSFQPVSNFYLGLPAISNVNLNLGNNSLSYDDVIIEVPEFDSKVLFLNPMYDIDNFLNTLNEDNDLFTEFSTNLLSFGVRAGESYFSFSVQQKSDLRMSYPKDLATLILKGNNDYKGENLEFGSFSIASHHYLEYSLGYSRKIFDNLSFGLNLKYLNGLGLIQSKQFDLGLYTSEDGDSLSLTSDVVLQATAPVNVQTDSLNYVEDIEDRDISISDAFSNPGFAVDFGATYDIMENLQVSASVIDLGFISYNNFVHDYRIEGQYGFTGIDVSSEFNNEDNTDPMDGLEDSLKQSIQVDYSEQGFLHFLGPKIYLGGRYYVGERLDFGLLSRTHFYSGRVFQSFTLSANTRPIRGISFTASYSVLNNSYNNLGLGLILRLGPFQVYTMSDTFSAGLWPHKTQSFNFRFGLNFAFGNNPEKRIRKDVPMIR